MIELYIVQNKEGKYFRARGQHGYGETWVEDIQKAKVYGKIGQARSRVSYFYKNWPEYGMPIILKIDVIGFTVINESERVEKAIAKRKKRDEEVEVRHRKWAVESAESELKKAQEKLKALRTK
jgi:hypothetical protein